MPLIRREWTAREADEWTREDLITVIISPIIYMCYMLGTTMSILLLPIGFAVLTAGIILNLWMIYIINPKLDKISGEYEKKQKQYLEDLEKKVKWED